MRIIIYLFILCAMPAVGYGQDYGTSTPLSANSMECKRLRDKGEYFYDNMLFQQCNDSLRIYIENCFNEPNSWDAFITLSGATGGLPSQQYAWEPFREWLKSVLYLNTKDSDYYCADVWAILSTFNYFNDERGKDINGSIAVLNYIIESGRCSKWDFIINAEKNRIFSRNEQLNRWRDTVTDSIATPLDTTLPTLEDLGLGILRGSTSVSPVAHEPRLGELIATRNPFTDILELKYRLDKSAMVRIDVYDLLGRAVYSEGQGYKAEGEHVLSLQSKSWSSGSYHVRLSSPSGEVKTVKVVKE